MDASASDLLEQLVAACDCEVSVSVNEHRNYYETVEQFVKTRELDPEPATLARMMELNTIVQVQVYPSTPIGFFHVVHWDLDTALRLALDAVASERKD